MSERATLRHSVRRAPPLLQAALAGVLAAAALPPVDFIAGLAAYGWLLALLLGAPTWAAAWRRAFLFAFAQAVAGLHWIAVAFTVDVDRFGALAVPAVLLLCVGIGLIQGTTASMIRLRVWRSRLAAALVFAPLWLAGEGLRSLIGQFPWNLVGYTFVDWPSLAHAAAIGSVWWLGWLALMLGTLPLAIGAAQRERRIWLVGMSLVLVAVVAWSEVRRATESEMTEVRLRLVQGSFPLDHGFEPERLRAWFFNQIALSAQPTTAPVDAIIWAEGASPYHLARDPEARRVIAEMLEAVPGAASLITGADDYVRDASNRVTGVTNSLFVVDRDGEIAARYDKVDLVPFGEFLPFRAVLERLGLDKVTAGSVDYVRGSGRQTIDLDKLPPFTPLICYEAIFATPSTGTPRPDWLLNVTNDTWFGRTLGPYQHLAMARLRTIELGLPMVRVANSGVTSVIDASGRVVEQTSLGPEIVLDVELPAPRAPTPFARYGTVPVVLFILAAAVLGLVRERQAVAQSA